MPTHRIRRGAAVLPGETGKADSSPIYVSTADSTVKVITGTAAVENELRPVAADVVIAGDGAVVVVDGTTIFTKGSAAAITLAAPTAAQARTRIRLVAGSAFAHVVTATALIDDGVTGGSKTTLTFGAFVGASIELLAYNLKWVVISKNVVTIT